jgi:hypothetical protein
MSARFCDGEEKRADGYWILYVKDIAKRCERALYYVDNASPQWDEWWDVWW